MKHWIAVASAEHVRLGRAAGFMQVSHGKAAPLRRIAAGDLVAYYSPTVVFGNKDAFRSLTAIGTVLAGEPYQVDMGGGFQPFRRDVQWSKSREVPIGPLLEVLEFTSGRSNWGYQLRFGLFEISSRDIGVIASSMQARLPRPGKEATRAARRGHDG